MTATTPAAYLRTKVMTASPAELRLMLFDGAIRFGEQAREGLERKDYEAVFTGITRCQAIIMELINGLRPDRDPDLCRKLTGLYTFMYTRLMSANAERNAVMVDEVLKLLRYERETWTLVLEKLAEERDETALRAQHPGVGSALSVTGHAGAVTSSQPHRELSVQG